jgi:hypothetical protein
MLYLSYYLLHFLFNKVGEQEGRSEGGEGEVAQTVYTHVSKCKNSRNNNNKNVNTFSHNEISEKCKK